MGSWSERCCLSGLAIAEGSPAVELILTQDTWHYKNREKDKVAYEKDMHFLAREPDRFGLSPLTFYLLSKVFPLREEDGPPEPDTSSWKRFLDYREGIYSDCGELHLPTNTKEENIWLHAFVHRGVWDFIQRQYPTFNTDVAVTYLGHAFNPSRSSAVEGVFREIMSSNPGVSAYVERMYRLGNFFGYACELGLTVTFFGGGRLTGGQWEEAWEHHRRLEWLEEVAYLSHQNHVKVFDAEYEPYNGHKDIPGQQFLDLDL